jgi:hypothetical protein
LVLELVYQNDGINRTSAGGIKNGLVVRGFGIDHGRELSFPSRKTSGASAAHCYDITLR